MAQEVFEPQDLLSKVAMLVLEARTPHPSPKGRVEGPHCSWAPEQLRQHDCRPEAPECAKAHEVRQSIEAMCLKGVPFCMDILLFPECSHGRVEARSLDGAGSDFEENTFLLERWSIKSISTWQRECREGVGGNQLLQAVRSYLHFSQLSSWLTSMHGCLPANIAYRLYAPGDCGDVAFTETPETHVFPTAVSSPHTVKVTVVHLPRLPRFPELRCAMETLVLFGMRSTPQWCRPKSPKGGTEEGGRSKKGGSRRRGRGAQYAKFPGSQHEMTASASNNRQQQPTQLSKSPPHEFTRPSKDITKSDQSPRGVSSKHIEYKRRPTREDKLAQDPCRIFPEEKQRHSYDERGPFRDDRRPALEFRKGMKAASYKRMPTQDNKRPLPDSPRQTPYSKRPAPDLSSPSYSRTDDPSPRPFRDGVLSLSDEEDLRTMMPLQEKDGSRGKGGDVKPSSSATRESLESQLRPLELTTPKPAQSLDLHSPKVLMSEVFYNPSPAHCRMQLDLSHPGPGPAELPGRSPCLNPMDLLMQRCLGHGTSDLLCQLEMSTLYLNFQSLAYNRSPPPPPPPPQDRNAPVPVKMPESFVVKAFRHWTQEQRAAQGQEGEGADQRGRKFYEKALQYRKDRPAHAHTDSSPSSTETAQRPGSELAFCSTASGPPKSAEQASVVSEEPRCSGGNSLKRSSPELPTRKIKVKKSEGAALECREEDSTGLIESAASSETYDSQKSDSLSIHSTPSVMSDSGSQTVREQGKSVQTNNRLTVQPTSGQLKIRPTVDALSDSWSSSSSSSSSTYSSSPKVLRESGDRHSDSSTPTNLSTSPLPEDQPSLSCHVRPAFDVASLPPSADSASDGDIFGPRPSQDVAKPSSPSVQAGGDSVLRYMSKKVCQSDTEACDGQSLKSENQRVLKEADSTPPVTFHLHSPEPIHPENAQRLEDHGPGVCEGDDLSRSSSSGSLPSSNEILTDVPQEEKDHSRFSLPSKTTEHKSTDSRQSSPDRVKSPCTFYLGSSGSPEKVCQWERVLDQETEENSELTSLLGKLCLKPPGQSSCSSMDQSCEPQPQPNGCAANEITKFSSQCHANGHLSGDVVHNGTSRSAADRSLSSSLSRQLAHNGCSSTHPADETSLLIDDCVHPSVSVPNSSLVPPQPGKAADQRKTKSAKVPSSSRSVETPFLFGAKNNLAGIPMDSETDDSVFHDKVCDVFTSGTAPCPMRTKSAPSFSCLTEKTRKREEEEEERDISSEEVKRGRSAMREKEGQKAAGSDRLRHRLLKSASILFNSRGSVPSQSSPAPIKRRSTGRFDYDETLTTTKAIKSAISLSRLPDVCKDSSDSLAKSDRVLSTSAPASTNCLLGNFEESILNGRLEPAGVVEGFTIDIGASGKFCPRHVSLPVTSYFFNLSDDNAPSPYLGHINLDTLGKRGYHIPNVGTLQVTLFNPNRTVVKMFVVKYDLQDMPPNSQTVLRQRTVYQPLDPLSHLPSYLRYLIHLRISSSSSGKTYLHTDIRLIFARNKFELDSSEVQYKLCSYTETPVNPKYSPKR